MNKHAQPIRLWLLTSFLIGSSLLGWNCSGKKETKTEASAAASDSTVFGRQGDTVHNELNAPEQAPPDSADRGAVVPAQIKVKPKK